MRFLLDANAVIDYLRGHPQLVEAIYRDVMIAAQAKKRGLTVVTNNTGDFFRLAGIKVENWTL